MDTSLAIGIILTVAVIILVVLLSNKKTIYDNKDFQNDFDEIRREYENRIELLELELNTLKTSDYNPASSTLRQTDINELANQIANQKFERWKEDYEEEIRIDAKNRQRGKIISSIDAQMMPLLGIKWFPGKFYEARFIGNPVTYVVFKNLDNVERDLEIEFVEITSKNIMKAGRVKRAVERGNVKFTLIDKKD